MPADKVYTEGHPLFPLEEGETEGPEIGWIMVSRWENGAFVYARDRFPAAELTEISQIADMFGGGAYELVARNSTMQRITARRKYVIPGEPLPIKPEDPSKNATHAHAGGSTLQGLGAFNIGGANGKDGAPWWMPLALALLPVVSEHISRTAMAQAQAQQAMLTQTQSLMAAIMSQGQNNANSFVQAMQSMHMQSATQMLEALKARGGGSGGGIEDFMKGIEFMSSALEEKRAVAEANGDNATLKTISDIAQTLQQMGGLRALFAGAPPVPPAAPSIPAVTS